MLMLMSMSKCEPALKFPIWDGTAYYPQRTTLVTNLKYGKCDITNKKINNNKRTSYTVISNDGESMGNVKD